MGQGSTQREVCVVTGSSSGIGAASTSGEVLLQDAGSRLSRA